MDAAADSSRARLFWAGRPGGNASRSYRLLRPQLGGWNLRSLLHFGDAVAAAWAVVVALWIWSAIDGHAFTLLYVKSQATYFLLIGAWLLQMRTQLAYHPSVSFSLRRTAIAVARAAATGAGLYAVFYFFAPREMLPRLVILNFLALTAMMTLAWRATCRHVLASRMQRVPVAVVGTGPAGRFVAELLMEKAPHKEVVALVHVGNRGQRHSAEQPPVVAPQVLRQLVAHAHVSELVAATDGETGAEVLRTVVSAQERGIDVVSMQAVYEELLRRLPLRYVEPARTVASLSHARRISSASWMLKRGIDAVAGCIGCAVLALLLPVLALGVWLDVGRPVFFRQERLGLAGRPFRLIKLRTMAADSGREGTRSVGVDGPRVSGFGRFLRRSRLDETPQFWNVLWGEMSLVGPRPEWAALVDELVRRIPCYRERLFVRPGLTGWAQVNYGYASSVEDVATRLEYDLYYIKHRSLWLDAEIVWRTVWTMVTLSGR